MSTDNERVPRESVEGVDVVLDRMYELTGAVGASMAMALDVAPETIKTWRKRGAVPLRFLSDFAERHGVSVDVIRFGAPRYSLGESAAHVAAEPGAGVLLSPRELALVRHYRKASRTGQAALDMVAAELACAPAAASAAPAAEQHQVNVSAPGGNAAGRDMVVTQNKGGRNR